MFQLTALLHSRELHCFSSLKLLVFGEISSFSMPEFVLYPAGYYQYNTILYFTLSRIIIGELKNAMRLWHTRHGNC